MARLIDISAKLRGAMPVWPGSVGIRVDRTLSFAAGDDVNVSRLDMDVHCGTHIEAPLHFIDGGKSLEEYPLTAFVGPAWVADIASSAIGERELESAGIPAGVERLLIRTHNSEWWGESGAFRDDYAALTRDGASWIVARGIRLVGIDYLSVQLFGDPTETHRILMQGDVLILEGLDLATVEPGRYGLSCLPLRIAGVEAAPVRAVLVDET